MPLPTDPPIGLREVQAEFSAPLTAPLSDFVRGGTYVPDTGTNAGVPTAKPIALRNLLGASDQDIGLPPVLVNTTPNYTTRDINLMAINAVVAQPYSDADHHVGAHMHIPTLTAFDLEIANITLYVYRAGLLEGVVGLTHAE